MRRSCNREIVVVLGVALVCCFWSWLPVLEVEATQVTYDGRAIIIDGIRRVLFSGAIHYPRSTPEMWPDLIQKAKDGGIDVIETYVFWDLHEIRRRQYDFSGGKGFIKFLKTVQNAGLYAFLRIGPYVCAEWNYGGFPVWLHNLPGIQLRTNNQVYKEEMQNFTTLIVDMCKRENLFAPQGGPIILAQIENEYGNIMGPYREAGKEYIKWCAKMATAQNIGVPWIMCKQSDAPYPMINTCNGFYCDGFKPNNPNSPIMWTESWIGWFKTWGGADPHRATEDVAFSIARFFQFGGVFHNYYMYHGGTNFGRTPGGYITTSYDYDALLDEYGNLNQPKWGHLTQLHAVIKSAQSVLTYGTYSTKLLGAGLELTTYVNNGTGESICFLSNANTVNDTNIVLQSNGNDYFVPAWSATILANCSKEVYNTAKVNTQTSLMTKKPATTDQSEHNHQLKWVWKPEPVRDVLKGWGPLKVKKLLEQKSTTIDVSDYLWYMTSVLVAKKDAKKAILRVNTTGHVLHAFVNRRLVGSQWGQGGNYGFVFERPIMLKPGQNQITLLSATVGLQNYGPFFDLTPTGIAGGPVQLVLSGNVTKDLSSNQWYYKIGLNGELMQFYKDIKIHHHKYWRSKKLPINRPMTWYKTTFKTPLGTDAVVVDMVGMGKGHAWVNGESIGRFWPAFLADKKAGCNDTCDYRGTYDPTKCLTNCGNPSQRWYHIPRSFLMKNRSNTLILFEEIGGNPSQVSFQTVTVGTACGNAYEGNTLQLSCQGGRKFTAIQFASFGDPQGSCGMFRKGTCESANTLNVVRKACLGQERCKITSSEATFGSSKCNGNITRRLAVQAIC
ncbi:PREDICTED: beta-galactosidase 15-like [Nelumbo nucifera]|uniref:Beta-galactosidase n=1 Tax=Nelumbo nucifera TaxID=4432 RepID=A0A1U8B3U9_NELNU|nr:PREDICTED: beta-galactosidase 15-like [Nelumbo nucifera]